MAGFMEVAIRVSVPGEIGMTARLYLESLDGDGRALATRYEYWRELTRLGEMFPDTMPGAFTTLDIEAYLSVRCQGTSSATRKKALAILSGYFAYLHDRGGIPTNPTRPIRRPKLPEPEPTWWTGEEVRRILAVPMQPRDHLLLETLARTAQRSGSVRALQWKHIRPELADPMIHFPTKGAKGGKLHAIPMDRELIHDFTVYKRLIHPSRDDYVFQSRNRHTRGANATGENGPISTQQVNRIIEDACRKAGVRVGTAHEFRRSAITNMLHAGVPLDVVSRTLPTTLRVVTTMRHYRGSEPQRVREALRGLPY